MDEVEELIKKLKDPACQDRDYAAMELGESKDPRAALALVEALGDDNRLLIMEIKKALVNIGKPAVPALIESFGEKDEKVQQRIATILGRIGDKKAVPTLVENLDGKSDEALMDFFGAFAQIMDPEPIPYLMQAFDHSDKKIRKKASEALLCIGKPAVSALLEAIDGDAPDIQHLAYDTLIRVSSLDRIDRDQLVSAHKAALCFEDEGVRCSAAEHLLELGYGSIAVPVLIEALGYADETVATGAAYALIEFAPKIEVNLSDVQSSLIGLADKVRGASKEEKDNVRAWIAETYQKIAKAVSERRQRYMPGELLPAKIKPPKKRGMYRMRRAVNG